MLKGEPYRPCCFCIWTKSYDHLFHFNSFPNFRGSPLFLRVKQTLLFTFYVNFPTWPTNVWDSSCMTSWHHDIIYNYSLHFTWTFQHGLPMFETAVAWRHDISSSNLIQEIVHVGIRAELTIILIHILLN